MKKIVSIALMLIIMLGIYTLFQYYSYRDGKLHIYFCDVGQGDAVLIVTPTHEQILIDGGPATDVLSCLAAAMPFWDRTIELMILTHPHLDHYQGLSHVVDRYKVKAFATEKLQNDTKSFEAFYESLSKKQIPINNLFAGDNYEIGTGITLLVLSPDSSFLNATSTNGNIRESGEFASLIMLLSHGNTQVLLTGDSQAVQLRQATQNISNISILHVPHHGSRSGLTKEILTKLNPQVSVISVGKNSYGHPSPETLSLLDTAKSKIFRTDFGGTVHIESRGETWGVRAD